MLYSGYCGLSNILLFAGYARDGKVPFAIVYGSCGHAGGFPTMIHVRTMPACLVLQAQRCFKVKSGKIVILLKHMYE